MSRFTPHIKLIKSLIQKADAKTILEFGTNEGESTRMLAELSKAHVWTVDKNPPTKDWLSTYIFRNCITFIQSDTMKLKWDKEVDILFIDDNHSYPHVLKELRKFGPMVKVGGYILLDDTHHHDFLGSEKDCGIDITMAIQRWTREVGLDWTNYHGGMGLAVIPITKKVQTSKVEDDARILERMKFYKDSFHRWLIRRF
ncbi:class I SAM-dependent methyltransferase [Patescibacteria group bacterium]|nr:class I SAM-dependent methyltransferase [Patescibacteria group bacterium]